MALKFDLTAPDLDKQIDLLRHFPELTDQHYRPAAKRNIANLKSFISARIPELTGRARDTFKSRVTGKGMGISGRVGWFNSGDPWYPNVLEYGAKEHPIEPGKEVRALRWMVGGKWAFAKRVEHPGISALGFMAAGYSAYKDIIVSDIHAANEAILRDMKVR